MQTDAVEGKVWVIETVILRLAVDNCDVSQPALGWLKVC
jgi:hypothetical protein